MTLIEIGSVKEGEGQEILSVFRELGSTKSPSGFTLNPPTDSKNDSPFLHGERFTRTMCIQKQVQD